MKKSLAIAVGFLVGLLLFAVGREIAFDARSWLQLFRDALHAVGRLGWVDTTLVTGLAAVTAAVFSIRAVGAQIKASDDAIQRQMDHATELTQKDRQRRHDAAFAVLPLTLSLLIDSSQQRASALRQCIDQCTGKILPRSAQIPEFEAIPSDLPPLLRDILEVAPQINHRAIKRLIVSMQVQQARLSALGNEHSTWGMIVMRSNLLAYIVGEAEIYARASQLYLMAVELETTAAEEITKAGVGGAVFSIGIYDQLRDEIVERFGLDSNEPYRIQ